ncbi:MAG TPA: DUF2017 family protein [Acidimicrobiales bacterium]|nr:DUF2017 family protein [Acidimicrobiales bacterium]
MPVFRSHLVRHRGDGRYQLRFPPEHRQLLGQLVGELRAVVTSDEPGIERLFPSPYPDDPERDAGWHALVRHELVERHLEAIEVVETTLDADELDEDELARWMTAVNALRVVLGTRLDVSEDDEPVDPSDPRFGAFALYDVLGWVLDEIVRARSDAL